MKINDKTIRALIALFAGCIAPMVVWLIVAMLDDVRRGQPIELRHILPGFYLGTYILMLPGFAIGWPAYVLMQKTRAITLPKCLLTGFLIGILPYLVALSLPTTLHDRSLEQWGEDLMVFCFVEAVSMGAAFITWLVWRYLPGGDRAKSNG